MNDSTNLRVQTIAALSEMFFEKACLAEDPGIMESVNQLLYRVRRNFFLCA